MDNKVHLRKTLRSKATPWIDWEGWTNGRHFYWLRQLHRIEPQIRTGDIEEGERTYGTAVAAIDALLNAAARNIADGFGTPKQATARPQKRAKPAKPLPRGKTKAPRWLAKVDRKELARIRSAITSAGLEHREADLESLLRPAIHLTLKPVKPTSIKGVVTRFGGDPDLPPKFAWPKHGKTPLAFLTQYRLDELAPFDLERRLPRRGVLTLFAHLVPTKGYGEHAVAFHFSDVNALTRTAPPHGPEADGRPTKAAIASPRVTLTLPPPDHPAVRGLKLGDDADRYHDGVWLATCPGRDELSQPGAHQLLGWPDAMTDYLGRRGWELLAQIDSDDRFGFELGDVETLRIHVAANKLAAGDFRGIKATTMSD